MTPDSEAWTDGGAAVWRMMVRGVPEHIERAIRRKARCAKAADEHKSINHSVNEFLDHALGPRVTGQNRRGECALGL